MSYSKADDRVRKLRTLEKLLEIAKSARSADTVKALDDLQAEIDDIQADMIREVEASTLDETAMMAYAMSIERAQLAISDRRDALCRACRPGRWRRLLRCNPSLYCAATAPYSAPPRATKARFCHFGRS